ncbi:MAG TPA: hypothetical protein EYP10_15085, partial [Armatimonadetes bacterium]|nr:hypothetical protein [Armatimonadota bacterium]
MAVVCIFEDEKWTHFKPLTWNRPACALKCGTSALYEKVKRLCSPDWEVHIHCRSYIAPVLRNNLTDVLVNEFERLRGQDIFFVNGRVLVTPELQAHVGAVELGVAYVQGENVLGAYLDATKAERVIEYLSRGEPLGGDGLQALLDAAEYRREVPEVPIVEYPWEL